VKAKDLSFVPNLRKWHEKQSEGKRPILYAKPKENGMRNRVKAKDLSFVPNLEIEQHRS
jgi:hypothetical protein